MLRSKSIIAIPPGETIREQLEQRGMMQKEFALRMDLSEKHISRLINGQVELTQDVALRLESVLGIAANFWNNLEMIYREKLTRVIEENEMEKDEEISLLVPYSQIAKLGWVPETKNLREKAINLRIFFEVVKLELLEKLRIPGIAYRTTGTNVKSDYSLAVWAQKARIEARKLTVSSIDVNKLNKEIPQFRKMTMQNPQNFSMELTQKLADCGVAIVFLPHIGGSFLHGATFIDGNKIVMGLTIRGKYADQFWFSFFHELHHIISGHIYNKEGSSDQDEEEADTFAKDTLIPQRKFKLFIDEKCFTKECIISFARDVNIGAGIVLGRLQKEKVLPYNRFNQMKEKYKIDL